MSDENVTEIAPFEWDERRSVAATLLASGHTFEEAGREAGVTRKTVHEWNKHPDFAAEVDRLTLISDVALRAFRLRMAMRIVRSKGEKSRRDLLEWLKYVQSETDGAKLDIAAIFGDSAGASKD